MMINFGRLKEQITEEANRIEESRLSLAYHQGLLRGLQERYLSETAERARAVFAENGPFPARMRDDFESVEYLAFSARSNDEMRKYAGKKVRVTSVDGDTIFVEGCPYAFYIGYLDGETI